MEASARSSLYITKNGKKTPTQNPTTYKHMHPQVFSNILKICGPRLPTELWKCRTQWTIQGKWPKKNEVRILWRGARRSGVSWGVPGEVVALMAIASQHPIVSGLGGRSNLGAEVVVFCILAEQKSYPVRPTGGVCSVCSSLNRWRFKWIMTRVFGVFFFFYTEFCKTKKRSFIVNLPALFMGSCYLLCGFKVLKDFVIKCMRGIDSYWD